MTKGFRTSLAATVAGAVLAAAGSPAWAETLADAIALAYQTNPTLAAERANVRFIEESYIQARAGFRPSITAQVSADYQRLGERAGTSPFGQPTRLPAGDSNSGTASVQVNQPLYTGGRASSAAQAAMADVLAEKETLRQTEADVIQQVIQSYVDVRRDQRALAIRQENVAVLRRQVEETRTRFDVGEVTKTDVAQSEASLAQAQSELATAQAQLALTRATYAQVVGQSPGELAQEPRLILPASLDEAFDSAQRHNPNIRAAEYGVQGAQARLSQARAERRPTVSLQGTYAKTGTPLSEVNTDNYSDVLQGSVTFTQPIYAGGAIESGVRQAVERENFFRIQMEGARRTAIQGLSQAWNQLLAARASISANEEQVRAAKIAFEGAQAEQAVGLRTTLEVLTAQQTLRDAELALINARRDEYVAQASVLNVTGVLAAANIVADLPRDPGGHDQRRLVKQPGWVPWEGLVERVDGLGGARVDPMPAAPDLPLVVAPGSTPPPSAVAAPPGPGIPPPPPAPAPKPAPQPAKPQG